uniref:acid phosphatase n=1 Tax=Comana monomorpha TaxID=1555636 RepID=A0AAU6PBP9_9NEOP
MELSKLVFGLIVFAFVCGQEMSDVDLKNHVKTVDEELSNTDLMLVFAMFRHGDRTPDQEEIALNPSSDQNSKNIFFPYGKKALTNKGKVRAFLVGEYLRRRYDGFLSRLYLPEEISVRTTDYARTKMTALAALAAMYPPLPAQKWNPALNWQPIPYDTLAFEDDDLLYWYNCEQYLALRNKIYGLPEVRKWIESYDDLFVYLSEHTITNVTTPEDVFYLDNLFQAMENVGVEPPEWAREVMPKIKDVTKIEFGIEFYNSELIRLASGVLINDIKNDMEEAIRGNEEQPKLRIYSAHENNVAALMAAARVFQPHQPKYGSTFTLELRKNRLTGQYGVLAVYAPNAGEPEKVLPIAGCGSQVLCEYKRFLNLTQEYAWTKDDFRKACHT